MSWDIKRVPKAYGQLFCMSKCVIFNNSEHVCKKIIFCRICLTVELKNCAILKLLKNDQCFLKILPLERASDKMFDGIFHQAMKEQVNQMLHSE